MAASVEALTDWNYRDLEAEAWKQDRKVLETARSRLTQVLEAAGLKVLGNDLVSKICPLCELNVAEDAARMWI